MLDTTVDPPVLVDTDGDGGTTDGGYPMGVTAIELGDPRAGPWALAMNPAGDWLYATSYRQPFLYAIRLGAHGDRDLVEPADIIGINVNEPPGIRVRSDGLALSPDGSRLYFTNFTDTSVRVFSVNQADGSDVVEIEQIPIPNAVGDIRHIAVHPDPDGSFVYVTSGTAAVTDIFEFPNPACGTPPCYTHVATIPTGQESGLPVVSPNGEFLYVPSKGAGGVAVIDLRSAEPTYHQILSVTGTGLAGAVTVSLSPGLETPICDPCTPSDVIEPTDGVTVDFSTVSGSGSTTVTSANVSDVPAGANFMIEGLPVYYNVCTTATFTGPIHDVLRVRRHRDDALPGGSTRAFSRGELRP